jgi:hypothetical protein
MIAGRGLLSQQRAFSSVAYNVKSKFEQAYAEKVANLEKAHAPLPQPSNSAEYGQAYYNSARMEKMEAGYVHPYHTEGSPIYMSNLYFMRTLFQAVGPEQVSPHYETLTRSRRGLLFLGAYIGSINTISRFGGWEHNEWLRALIWHHEFLIALYVGYIEVKHFSAIPGPKFSIFYNTYSGYEYTQLANQWADSVEMCQNQHLRHTKEQLEYSRLDREYDFVKKRALVNFLTSQKLASEAHYHTRVVSMLDQIEFYEQANLKNELKNIAVGSVDKIFALLDDPAEAAKIKRSAFEAALDGIKDGVMTYKGDAVLPLIQAEMEEKLHKFDGLSAAEESALLSLTD